MRMDDGGHTCQVSSNIHNKHCLHEGSVRPAGKVLRCLSRQNKSRRKRGTNCLKQVLEACLQLFHPQLSCLQLPVCGDLPLAFLLREPLLQEQEQEQPQEQLQVQLQKQRQAQAKLQA
mmetsp:Transcript_77607/g.169932  ORF Transcript_77607/g.169932 Transcript_77607/m.169932 type:complete len:118 (+) Transcript_77607:162-515(+)